VGERHPEGSELIEKKHASGKRRRLRDISISGGGIPHTKDAGEHRRKVGGG